MEHTRETDQLFKWKFPGTPERSMVKSRELLTNSKRDMYVLEEKLVVLTIAQVMCLVLVSGSTSQFGWNCRQAYNLWGYPFGPAKRKSKGSQPLVGLPRFETNP